MKQPKIIVAGIGPGSEQDITPAVLSAVQEADVVVGYKYYFQFIQPYLHPETECIDTGMKRERTRAEQAFELAEQGKTVCVISSGDAGIYGMTPLIYEMKRERNSNVEVIALPGISAFQKAASLLGAPVGHDFCVISLSDLMTPWERIERRIRAAAMADFVTAVYNPKSEGRYWQLYRLKELFLAEGRAPETPVGYVRQAGREEQEVHLTTLADFKPEEVDMFTVILIGNSQSYAWNGKFITPRGYYSMDNGQWTIDNSLRGDSAANCQLSTVNCQLKKGQDIMIQSFRTIESELKNKNIPLDHKWALLHAIHTTADFEMEKLLYTDKGAVEKLYQKIADGRLKTIVTDVTMAASGIRKGALQRLGVEVKCYLSDERVAAMAAEKGITRTQAGIRLAVEEHPDALFVFGNAPTALMELCDLVRKGKAAPSGIIAAPVGFVHVQESKHMVKPFMEIPKLIVEGRKGGSNLAATLVNAILCYNDAEQLRPGRDV
nr:precorrin-3B C(17)-methyltransferase [Bacteroides timonensis]